VQTQDKKNLILTLTLTLTLRVGADKTGLGETEHPLVQFSGYGSK